MCLAFFLLGSEAESLLVDASAPRWKALESE